MPASAVRSGCRTAAAGWGYHRPIADHGKLLLLSAVAAAIVIGGCGSDGGGASGEQASPTAIEAVGAETSVAAAPGTASSATPSAGPAVLSVAPGGATDLESSTTTASATTSTVGSTSSTTTVPPSSATTTTAPGSTGPTSPPGEQPGSAQTVSLRFESLVADVTAAELAAEALAILNDPRGWVQAGFTFVADSDATFRVVLAEGPEVDQLCLPLRTSGTVSCQNGPVVALNADRWRHAVDHWVLGVEVYRGYLVNHEVGHLIGQRHPKPRCPVPGRPAGVMEQQTGGLEGCVGNPWPRGWELDHARKRPVVYAPLPDWGPEPVPANGES